MELSLAPASISSFALIPAGTFMMGTPGNVAAEFPHQVRSRGRFTSASPR